MMFFVPFLAATTAAAAFAQLGALSVKVSMLTIGLQAMAVVTLAAILFAIWARYGASLR